MIISCSLVSLTAILTCRFSSRLLTSICGKPSTKSVSVSSLVDTKSFQPVVVSFASFTSRFARTSKWFSRPTAWHKEQSLISPRCFLTTLKCRQPATQTFIAWG